MLLKIGRMQCRSYEGAEGKACNAMILMVGAEGFEPPTLCSQSRCATRLRYAPMLGLYRNRLRSGLPGEPLQEPQDEEDGR